MDGKSLNITEEKLNRLKEIIPEAFTENKIDWEKLKAALGDDIEFKNERYVLNWAGKSDAFRALQSPSTATLVPCSKESVNFDKTENIFIEGENLEVLKVLQKSYFGKIKMIYIDPPYNTGNDNFIYPDKFAESREEYLNRIGDKDETGFMTREGLFRKNSKDSGHYHSNWLSMMYPRLFLARNLLRDDGVIFVSIDDNEAHNLRLVMNEVFGEENFFAKIVIRANSRGQTYKQIAKTHEYILAYTKRDETDLYEIEKDEQTDDLNLIDDIGRFNIRELRNRNPKFGKYNRPNLFYPIYLNPDRIDKDGFSPVSLKQDKEFCIEILPLNSERKESCWRWGQTKFNDNIKAATLDSNVVAKKKSDGVYGIYEKYRKTTYKPKSIWDDNSYLTETGTVELKQLGFNSEFDFPKPVNLIKQCVALSTNEEDIILDFFSGSCSTAHAVLALNKEDNGNRKFIMVQLPEKCDESSEAYKAGYKTIAEIGKERIRRVIKKIKTEQEGKLDFGGSAEKQYLGFKVFKLRESNFKIWRSKITTEEELVGQLQQHLEPLNEGSKTENVLFELLLKSGVPLTAKIEEKNGYVLVNDNEIALMLEKADDKIVKKVIAEKPRKVITLDRLFKNNDRLKTNTALQMKDAGIEFKVI
ncbi:MAG: site-specific DNA-methyltransferase [Proteobacteria bacterium]|nr:site-specific DNA-methyltransferase [Pseudomonadota bacterium]